MADIGLGNWELNSQELGTPHSKTQERSRWMDCTRDKEMRSDEEKTSPCCKSSKYIEVHLYTKNVWDQ